jgi:hypothetical protein
MVPSSYTVPFSTLFDAPSGVISGIHCTQIGAAETEAQELNVPVSHKDTVHSRSITQGQSSSPLQAEIGKAIQFAFCS